MQAAAVELQPLVRSLTIQMRTYSEANRRDFWAAKARRIKEQRARVVYELWSKFGRTCPLRVPLHQAVQKRQLVVTLTRIAPRSLDSDNLVSSCKGIRDSVAEWIGVDDADKRVAWAYGQERGSKAQHAIRIEFQEPA